MLPTQLCKSTKVVQAANSTVQKYKGRACCQLNCAKVQRSCMLPTQLCKSTKVVHAANSTVQKYKGRACCHLNCAKVQRSCMLPSQLCKSTKVVHAANSTVQKYKGRACCHLNCAKVQRSCMLPSQLCKSTKVVGYSPLNQVQTRDLCRSSGSKGQRSWKCKVHYNYYNNIIDYNAHGYYIIIIITVLHFPLVHSRIYDPAPNSVQPDHTPYAVYIKAVSRA